MCSNSEKIEKIIRLVYPYLTLEDWFGDEDVATQALAEDIMETLGITHRHWGINKCGWEAWITKPLEEILVECKE